MTTPNDIIKTMTLNAGCRIVATLNGYRRQYGQWPTKLRMDTEMGKALKEYTFTPQGWAMLESKMEIGSCEGTLIAEGEEGRFEYDGDHSLNADGQRADVWLWGMNLAD